LWSPHPLPPSQPKHAHSPQGHRPTALSFCCHHAMPPATPSHATPHAATAIHSLVSNLRVHCHPCTIADWDVSRTARTELATNGTVVTARLCSGVVVRWVDRREQLAGLGFRQRGRVATTRALSRTLTHARAHARTHARTRAHTHTHIHTHIHTHTHTHTHTSMLSTLTLTLTFLFLDLLVSVAPGAHG
jgi:hypothetical protein